MKKLLTLVMLFAMPAMPVFAVQKCIALNSSMTTCTKSSNETYSIEWSANCTTNGASLSVKGIGICASNSASSVGAEGRTATLVDDSTQHVNCWCRLVSPVLSTWRFSHTAPYAGHCSENCANTCASILATNSDFRSKILSYGLSD